MAKSTASVTPPTDLPPELLTRWEAAVTDAERVDVLYDAVVRTEGHSRWKAAELALAAVKLASRSENPEASAETLVMAAFQLSLIGRGTDGFRYATEAARLCAAVPSLHNWYLRALSGRALARATVGDEVGARRDYVSVIGDPLADERTRLVAHINLADLLTERGRYRSAVHELDRADEVLETLTNSADARRYYRRAVIEQRASTLLQLAESQVRRGRDESAGEPIEGAAALLASLLDQDAELDPFERSTTAALRSSLARLRGDLATALTEADLAVELADSMGTTVYEQSYVARARVLGEMGRTAEAAAMWSRALAVHQRSGSKFKQEWLQREMATVAEARGDLTLALAHARKALELSRAQRDELSVLHEAETAGDHSAPDHELSWLDRLHMAERQAQTDQLTGLLNRFGMQAALPTLEQARSVGNVVQVVALLDIDHFKSINDEHSHAAGDEVLRRIATLIAQAVPTGTSVGRHGGEEFAVVANVDDARTARQLVDRVHAAVAAERGWPGVPSDVKVTASIGYSLRAVDEDYASTLARADRALYTAKVTGRNRVLLDVPNPNAG